MARWAQGPSVPGSWDCAAGFDRFARLPPGRAANPRIMRSSVPRPPTSATVRWCRSRAVRIPHTSTLVRCCPPAWLPTWLPSRRPGDPSPPSTGPSRAVAPSQGNPHLSAAIWRLGCQPWPPLARKKLRDRQQSRPFSDHRRRHLAHIRNIVHERNLILRRHGNANY